MFHLHHSSLVEIIEFEAQSIHLPFLATLAMFALIPAANCHPADTFRDHKVDGERLRAKYPPTLSPSFSSRFNTVKPGSRGWSGQLVAHSVVPICLNR